ncbi:hypothetical protein HDF16_004277 [Granulicella aggregans]|uniref:Uncharacterized protein n=1 Tax=Granulicella aggregans TaxID=474949 RepID=A0A7W8E5E0_9BACT|nr:hypothetical protein [Granulicella aggregans]
MITLGARPKGLSTIVTTFPLASLFDSGIACPYTFIMVWIEA